MVRITLPYHLQTLANSDKEIRLEVEPPVSVISAVRALEASFPMLRGAILDHYTGLRRPKVRFFACGEDVSLNPLDQPLPKSIVNGQEPLIIIGAISGG